MIPNWCSSEQTVAVGRDGLPLVNVVAVGVVADDLGEAGYRHSSPSKKELVRGGYVMPPEASSIDTLLSRSKALANQMREEADD